MTNRNKFAFWVEEVKDKSIQLVPRGYLVFNKKLTTAQLDTITKRKDECTTSVPLAILIASGLKISTGDKPINPTQLAGLFKTQDPSKINKFLLTTLEESKQERLFMVCSPGHKQQIDGFFSTRTLSKAEAVALQYAATNRKTKPLINNITNDSLATAVTQSHNIPCDVRLKGEEFSITATKGSMTRVTEIIDRTAVVFDQGVLAAFKHSTKSESTEGITKAELAKFLGNEDFEIIDQTVITTDANTKKLNQFKNKEVSFKKYALLFEIMKKSLSKAPVDLAITYLKEKQFILKDCKVTTAKSTGTDEVVFYIPGVFEEDAIAALDALLKSHTIELSGHTVDNLLRAASENQWKAPGRHWPFYKIQRPSALPEFLRTAVL